MWPFNRNDKITAGMPAPDFSLADTNGRAVRLSEFRGRKNIVLVLLRGFL